jgi:hypothetical protein
VDVNVLISTFEAARILNCTLRDVWALAGAGEFGYALIHGIYQFSQQEILDYCERRDWVWRPAVV